jgi:3-oxoacyl-[acyl-carrier protein] reductase
MRFQDRVAVVTGAASGFGEAIARRAADEGAAVVIGDRDRAGAQRVAAAIEEAGGRASAVEVDVSCSADVARLFEQAAETFGGVDVIVNNAGFSHRATPLVELAEEDFDLVFATNTKGVYLGAVHGVPHLRARGGGAIVNTASIGAVRPRPNLTAYNATKAAVVTLTRGLATELGSEGIRVNAVCPLASETPFLQSALGIEKLAPAVRQAMEKDVPLGRLTRPEDVAAAVLFLASDDAAFLTGVCLDVDGGKSIA